MAEYTPSPQAVEAFKRAWHEADAEGDEGNRVSRGLAAALAHHDAELRAEVERLRGVERGWQHDRAEWERERDEARQQVADLRAGIEALRRQWEGEVLTGHGARREGLRKALDDLAALAGSGEQPGEVTRVDVRGRGYGKTQAMAERVADAVKARGLPAEVLPAPAPVVPDSACGDYPAPCNCDDPETHDGAAVHDSADVREPCGCAWCCASNAPGVMPGAGHDICPAQKDRAVVRTVGGGPR